MTRENIEEYQVSVAVVHETVRAAVEFLRSRGSGAGAGLSHEANVVAEFIGWPAERVSRAMAAISDTLVSDEAMETSLWQREAARHSSVLNLGRLVGFRLLDGLSQERQEP